MIELWCWGRTDFAYFLGVVRTWPEVNQTDYISNTTVSSGIVRQTCRIAYRYICRHNISIGKGETPLFRVEQVETHTPPSRAAHPLNSLNTSQKNTPKSASVFFSSLFFLPLFPCFFYPSTLVPAPFHPASHCFTLLSLLLFLPLSSFSSSFSPFTLLSLPSSSLAFSFFHFFFLVFSFSKNQNLYMFIGRVTYE